MGGLGLQKVSPRSELRMLVSMMAPAGPAAGGWLLQICMNVVVRARGLPIHVNGLNTQVLVTKFVLLHKRACTKDSVSGNAW